jgi:predicted DNA-binding transcriptional regulator YafY
MNRIDRVTAILIQLQSKRVVKAQEMFTREEAIALLTAEKLVEKLTDGSTQQTYQDAMFKIKAVLRLTEKDHIESLEKHIEVIDSPAFSGNKTENAYLQQILKAIGEKLVINIDYFAEHSQEKTNRNIEPVGIFLMGRHWYLIAYCHLRKDYRTFKVDHIRYLSITAISYEAAHPSLQSFLTRVSAEKDLHSIVIRVEKSVLKWLGEQKFYHGFVSQEETANGDYELRFLTASLEGFARWYMLYGERASIIQPKKLTEIVRKNIINLSGKL